jgi:hypothetical protein
MTDNPYIKPYNYFEGYDESVKNLKNDSQTLVFSKLCYELFEHNETGKEFIKFITKNILLRPNGNVDNPHYVSACLYGEGFKGAFLMLMNAVESHRQLIKSETKANDSSITQ